MLAWMRLLADPYDAAAVVRALARPPIELRQVELARVIQVARRRKLGLVMGLAAATESPRVTPEARERIQRFVELHAAIAADFDTAAPQVFIVRLIERLRAGKQSLLSPEDAAREDAGLQRLRDLALEFVRSHPEGGTRELARHLTAVVPDAQRERPSPEAPPQTPADPSPRTILGAGARAGAGAAIAAREHEGEAPEHEASASEQEGEAELRAAFGLLREELLEGVPSIGGRLGELRLDTELDISHGVVRYLELLKVSALLQRPPGQSLAEAIADINARLLAAVTPLEREVLQTSTLDDTLRPVRASAAEPGARDAATGARERSLARTVMPREQHSLEPFLPRKGAGLALSASDIHTYRSCPLRYKYARVLRIPVEQTVHQRFGIVVHQVLERYHADGGRTLAQMLDLLDACWRRAGLRTEGSESELREKAAAALERYHARLQAHESEPVWFERSFQFRIGPHHLRGRVDRVDRLAPDADVGYELIDYKTSRPKSPQELDKDIQLSLYALAAREDWQLESSREAYYYVLDDLQVPVARREPDAESVRELVLEVGEGILAQRFDPTPAPATCSMCDYRIVCPAAMA